MAQEVHPEKALKQHTIWQNGQPPEPCAIVIFGATGDLTQRKLLPTLAHLFHDHPLSQGGAHLKPMNSSRKTGATGITPKG